MFIKCTPDDSISKNKRKQLPFKRRLQLKQKNKLVIQEFDPHNEIQPHFNPQAELKAKIIKAILGNSGTIQRQINYKKSMSSYMTPLKHKNGKCCLNLNLKQKNSPKTQSANDIQKFTKYKPINSERINKSLQINKIVQQVKVQSSRLTIKALNFKRCSSSTTNRSQNSIGISLKGQPKSKKGRTNFIFSPFAKADKHRQKQLNQIRPWGGREVNQKQRQFQFF